MTPHIKKIWQLGLPLSLTFVIQMAIVIIDSAFAGNLSYTDLAAVSLASSTFYIFLLLLIGICIASSVKAGQAIGANDESAMLNCFRQGILLSLFLGVFLSLLLLYSPPLMLKLGQKTEVVALAKAYLVWFSWTLPLQTLIVLFRSYFAVTDRPWASVLPVLLALLLNAFLDYCLSLGRLGFPEMGISGLGLASLISNVFLVFLMLKNIGWSRTFELFNFSQPSTWSNNGLGKLLLVSSPIAVTLITEEAFFSGTVFLAGMLGAAEQAAHQILFNTIGTSYLFNTGIAMACSIQIGKYIGSASHSQIMPTVKAGWILTFAFTLPFALILLFFSNQWIGFFLDQNLPSNQATVLFVKSVLILAIVMLIIDCVWLVVIESLHGMLDTTYPALSALIAYWLIGGPVAFWGTQTQTIPFTWIWIGMLLAAFLLTALVYFRLQFKLKWLNIAAPDIEKKPV